MRFRLLLLCALLAAPAMGGAHPLLQNAMWVQFELHRVHLAVNVSEREIAVAQGEEAKGAPLAAAAQRDADYILHHLTVSIGGRALAGKLLQITPPEKSAEPETTFYQYELEYPFDGPPPAEVTLREDMLREWPYAAGTPWDVVYIVRLKRSGSDEISTGLLREKQAVRFPTGWEGSSGTEKPAAGGGGWRTFGEYFQHGVRHILTGWDHLLFVSALVIATMNFWEMVKVIAAFTLAHTVTLTLSVFNILRLPSWVVEPVIALSIIFVAVENIFWPRHAHSWLRLGVAFGFGLIHGLGFAGGLLDAMEGLPRIGTWIALGAFSLGVEIGHQMVVLPLFGALALGRRRLRESFTRPALRYGSLFISLCGAYYFCVAVHEQFFAR